MANMLNSLVGNVMSTAWSSGSFAAKTLYRSGFSPSRTSRLANTGMLMGLGAIGGGIAGGIADDSNDPQHTLEAVLSGAALGAGGVLGARGALSAGKMSFNKLADAKWSNIGSAALGFGGKLYSTGKSVASMGLSATAFAINHPLGIAAAGAGIYGLAQATRLAGPDSPTMREARVNTRYDKQAIAAEQMQSSGMMPMGQVGTYPQMYRPMQDAMEQSTQNLVLGLHHGRHG